MIRLSVIVPVYNVEKYLKKCIESILAQSFKDFELILIDDGSTDSSGKICDEYEKRDARIIVIHKTNGGLSSARNAGLDIAKGKYIGFVDSDDWISPQMYEKLILMCEKNDLDMAVCGVKKCYNDSSKDYICYNTINDKILNREEAITEIFVNHSFGEEACNKIYKKDIFKTIRYPEGKIHEDTYCICDIVDMCRKIGYSKEIGYFYYQRSNSIMNSVTPNIDKIESVSKVLEYLKHYSKIYFKCSSGLLSAPLRNLSYILKEKTKNNNKYLKGLKSFYRKYRQNVIKNKYISKGEKIIMLSLSVSPQITKVLFIFVKSH